MELLGQAFMIMTLGMGLVFVFLFLVIQGMQLSARIIHHIEGTPQDDIQGPVGTDGADDKMRAAAIAVVLEIHSSKT